MVWTIKAISGCWPRSISKSIYKEGKVFMKRVAIVFFVIILASGFNVFAAELKIGYVDLQKLVANYIENIDK